MVPGEKDSAVQLQTFSMCSKLFTMYLVHNLLVYTCRPNCCGEEGLNGTTGSSECPTGTGLSGGSSAPGSFDHSGNVSDLLL